jgi:methionyl-tRNA synthetase
MPQDKFFITTPIYYVNDAPHIGHAYTSLTTDAIARFMRLSGFEVKYLTGTDEHGQKVEKSAAIAGKSPQEFADEISRSFQLLLGKLNISNDDFIRTTEGRHKKAVEALWQKLEESNNIYLGKYSGWYSVRDEAFYDESEIENGIAPTGAPVEWIEEPSYFFALSKWQDKLLEFYEKNPDFIIPKSRRNEVISFVKGGLHDLSVSRSSLKWGIPVPGNEKHTIYVWLDALTNYIAALGYPEKQKDFAKFWPANAHIVGKDILRFHAVYWPAFLMATGIEIPKSIVAHGWWTNEGQKISKSVGNVIDPFKLVDDFGIDNVRYFLLREVIFGNDGNYSRENLILRVNSELSNKIGNLVQRTCAFVYKNCDEKVPTVSKDYINEIYQSELFIKIAEILGDNQTLMSKYNINAVLDNIMYITEQANMYIDKEAPWALKKTDPEKMIKVLFCLMEIIRYIAILLLPFIPESADQILTQLGVPNDQRQFSHLKKEFALKSGSIIAEPKPIFPRLDK